MGGVVVTGNRMVQNASTLFPSDALEANRLGDLTVQQRRNFGALSNYRRRNALTIAAYLGAGAAIVYFLASPRAPIVQRNLISGAAVVLAAFFVVRAITGSDALTRDLRESRVQSLEGAIGKRHSYARSNQTTYYLEVGDSAFKIGRERYHSLPDAGWARVYYLPLSRTIVNYEPLPNLSPPPEVTAGGIVQSLGDAFFAGSRREANEARAGIAALGDMLKAPFDESPEPPPLEARDPRPLAEAIVGTWTNRIMRVTFSADGTVTAHTFVGDKTGRWSVDVSGRLRADAMGQHESIDAWIAGDRLTIAARGQGLTFTRET